jgi:protocatechuate 4,5-dioxygenase beta chain
VQITCVTHNPALVRRLRRTEDTPEVERGKAKWAEMRDTLARSRPDVLLVIANDHLNQWFMDNMPQFMIGKAPTAEGPFAHEMAEWGMSGYKVAIDQTAAKGIIDVGFRHGVDFAFSDEFTIDHAFTVPLTYLRPEADIPIVPLFANVMALPMPTTRRFHEVGGALARIVEELPGDRRVAALYSGHMSVEVGGPRMIRTLRGEGAVDPEFDRRMTELIASNDVESLLREATFERMVHAGHIGATGFMIFVMAIGMARGRAPTSAESVFNDTNTMPFFHWNLEA